MENVWCIPLSHPEMMRDIHDNAGAGASGAMEGSGDDGNGAAEVDMDDCGSLALPPDLPPYSGDYIISDYMERLGTRLNILETELKYAWRALDLLSQEYVRMWERLERLENLLADQQGVISTLLDFYTCRSVGSRDPMTRLEVIREILGNGTVEDGIEEGLDIGRSTVLDMGQEEEIMESNEAFYKSLNQAYRDDLVCEETSRPGSQLGMIWEAPEETEIDMSGSRQVYSSSDYKDYRGLQGSSGISDRDLAHLSTLSTIDQMTVDKLHELDRLSSQLHKDSRELQDLKSRILSPETNMTSKHDRDIEAKALAEDGNIINEQLKNVYAGSDNWAINDMIQSFDDFMLTMPKETTMAEKSPSRLSLAESTHTDRGIDYLSSSISPRRKYVPERTTTEPYTTVTGRLAYSSAVANAEINAAKASKSPSALSIGSNRFDYNSYQVPETSRQSYYSTKSNSQPLNEIYKNSADHSPVLSIHEIYSEPLDARRDISYEESRLRMSPSPPPPAPPNEADIFAAIQNNNEALQNHQAKLSTGNTLPVDGMRLSPRSPKSPKTSPKHVKRDSNNIVAAKSDSGLSSMSGWSSLEKSPGSPKTGKIIHGTNESHKVRISSPQHIQRMAYEVDPKPYLETLVDSYSYGQAKTVKSDYYTRKSEQLPVSTSKDLGKLHAKVDEGYLQSTSSVAPHLTQHSTIGELYYGNEAPSIYSVAGNRQPVFTTVYSTPRGMLTEENFSELLDRNEIEESAVRPTVDPYPPEPSYHAQTVVVPANKRTLTRANTMGANDPHFYQNSFKTGSTRTVYPPSNLTDALSYYPTSSRYDSPKRTSLEDQLSWQGGSSRSPTSSMETSSLKSHSLNIAERKQFQNQLQQEYFKQQQYDQRNGNVLYENEDYDQRQMTAEQSKMRKEQYIRSSSVLVSESGYLSIASDAKGKPQDKMSKKPKRTSSLKSAMSHVTHWLPDLHLPKKHRSHSLPSGVDTVEQSQAEKTLKERILSAQRRKKKYHLVASMSGLLQKARRKQQASHQSLSDPETSETEWSGGRSSAQSEDSDSVFSDTAHDTNMFPKIAPRPKQRKVNNQEIVEQQQKLQEMQQHGLDFQTTEEEDRLIEEDEKIPDTITIPRDKSDDIDFHFARVSQLNKDSISEIEKLDIDTDISNIDLYEEDEKEETQSPASLFATIGDVKKAAVSTDDSPTDNNKSYNGGGGSMEFAVSRALGKYRLRKSTSISDEHVSDISPPKIETETPPENSEDFLIGKERRISKSTTPEIVSSTTTGEVPVFPDRSPSIQSTRGVPNKFQPRHQQSLEIPNKHDDDDSKSTHSWRSGSRVSSRRQSTEDSIDSEDEWYCYELRKLEEMEHQNQLDLERQQTLAEEPEYEENATEPGETIKEQMSYVLRELKLKTATVKKQYDETPVKETWKDITTFPAIVEIIDEPVRVDEEDDDKSFADSGSGETSGPDSPVQSGDEFDDDYTMSPIPHSASPAPTKDQQPLTDAPVGSKWKLLKALKDRKAEEKTSESPVATTPSTEKDKVSAGVSYLMQKFHEIRVKS